VRALLKKKKNIIGFTNFYLHKKKRKEKEKEKEKD
jgi:hypothetical protein